MSLCASMYGINNIIYNTQNPYVLLGLENIYVAINSILVYVCKCAILTARFPSMNMNVQQTALHGLKKPMKRSITFEMRFMA